MCFMTCGAVVLFGLALLSADALGSFSCFLYQELCYLVSIPII
jgi:hypothetical protein